MELKNILGGYKIDSTNIQSVGNMAILPIISDTEFTDVADIHEVTLKKDVDYDLLEFSNSGGNIGIIIQGWTIITNQNAQDRIVPYAHLVKAGKTKVVPANCIQEHQCGIHNINKWDQSFMVLPPSLRGLAITKNSDYEFSQVDSLWESLSTWATGMNCREYGLTHFYSNYKDTLEHFVAEFEPVNKQLGAIVFINGELVAIDIVPTYVMWKRMWRTLIRDSYGAEAIRLRDSIGAVEIHPTIDVENIESLEDLNQEATKVSQSFVSSFKGVVSKVVDTEFSYDKLDHIDEMSMLKLNNDNYVGQGLMHGDHHFIYVSLIKTGNSAIKIEDFKSLQNDPYNETTFSFE
jgi:hypothetical protein